MTAAILGAVGLLSVLAVLLNWPIDWQSFSGLRNLLLWGCGGVLLTIIVFAVLLRRDKLIAAGALQTLGWLLLAVVDLLLLSAVGGSGIWVLLLPIVLASVILHPFASFFVSVVSGLIVLAVSRYSSVGLVHFGWYMLTLLMAAAIACLATFALRRTLRSLAVSERMFRKLFELSPDALFICDRDSRVRAMNNAAERLFDVSRDKALGRHCSDIAQLTEEQLEEVEKLFAEVTDGKDIETLRVSFSRLSGERRIAEMQMRLAEVGGDAVALVSLRDVTDRLRSYRMMRQQATAMNVASDGMAIIDEKGHLTYTNRACATLHGYSSPRELLGRTWEIFYDEMEQVRLETEINPLLQKQDRWQGEIRATRKDGSSYAQQLSITRLTQGGFIAVMRDISERKEMEQRLRQSERMSAIGKLTGEIAHSLKNVLTAVNGFSELAMSDLPADSPVRGDLEEIAEAGQRATRLVRRLLAFARQQPVTLAGVDLSYVIGGFESMLRELVRSNIALELSLCSEMPPVRADVGMLEEVILNLTVNASDAIEATQRDDGRITITTGHCQLEGEFRQQHPEVLPGDYAWFRVTDNGVGMTEDIQDHLFEPFYTTKAGEGGTGLGLASSYGIVKQHKGYIYAQSVPGQGSTFTVYLPVVHGEIEMEPCQTKRDRGEEGGQEVVLLVDDEAGVLEFAARSLRRLGYQVIEATNGREALQRMTEEDQLPDILICDLVMPQMGGLKLASQLKMESETTKVLFMSAYPDDAIDAFRQFEAPAHLMQKPFTNQDLAERVRRLLDS